MKPNAKHILYGALLSALVFSSGSAIAKKRISDFPTQARVEYVLACIGGREVNSTELRECSCVVDIIAAHLSYEDFLRAKTLSAIQQTNAPNAEVYQTVTMTRRFLDRYLRAQASAELQCF